MQTKTNPMFKTTLLLSLLCWISTGCIIIPTYDQNIKIATKHHWQKAEPRHILFIGTGPVGSRVFLDNLTSELITTIKRKGKEGEFAYLGKRMNTVPLPLDSLMNPRFDTYIVFRSSERTQLNMTMPKATGFGPGGFVATQYGNQFVDTYRVSVLNAAANLELAWEGILEVDIDLAVDTKYKTITDKLCRELAKNGIVLK